MRIIGIVIMILAAVITVVPRSIDCQAEGRSIATVSGKSVAMRCHYTALAEMALGLPLLALGATMATRRSSGGPVSVGVIGMALGLSVALVPTVLIGVCASNDMKCNMVMKPLLLYTGALILVLSLASLLHARRTSQPKPAEDTARDLA